MTDETRRAGQRVRVQLAAFACLAAGVLMIVVGFADRRPESNVANLSGGLSISPAELTVARGESDDQFRVVELTLVNSSRRTIRILDVKGIPSCCTVIGRLPRMELAPGEALPLHVEVVLPATGHGQAAVRVRTDAPDTPEVVANLHLQGEDVSVLRVIAQPDQIVLVGDRPGEGAATQVMVRTVEHSEQAPWLSGFVGEEESLESEPLTVSVKRSFDAGLVWREYVFEVSAPIPHATVPQPQYVRLADREGTPIPGKPILLQISSVKLLHALPSALLFTLTEEDELPLERRLQLRGNSSEGDAVRAEADANWLNVAHWEQPESAAALEEPAGPRSRSFLVSVESPPQDDQGNAERRTFTATIFIHTGGVESPAIEIPVTLIIDQ